MPDTNQLLIQVVASVELARQNLNKMEASVAGFQRNTNRHLSRVDGGFTGLSKSVGSLKSSISGFAVGGIGGLLAGFGVETLISVAKSALETGSALAEVSQQLGITTDDLQTYRYIATQVGISQDEIEGGLQKLTKTLGLAGAGNKKAAAAFDDLGINIRNADGHLKTAGQAIPLIADALAKIPDPAARAAAEVALFGKTGQQLDTLLSGGSAALNGLAAEYEKLGIKLSPDQIKKLDAAADGLAKLKVQLEGKITVFLAEHADEIIAGVNAITEALEALFKIIKLVHGVKLPLALLPGPVGTAFQLQEIAAATAADRQRQSATFTAKDYARGSTLPARPAINPAFLQPRTPSLLRRNFADQSGGLKAQFNQTLAGLQFPKRVEALKSIQKQVKFMLPDVAKLLEDLDQINSGFADQANEDISRRANEALGAEIDRIDQAGQAKLDKEDELLAIREDHERELAGLYRDLFDGGTKSLWANFRQIGLNVIAEVLAKLSTGQSFASALGSSSGGSGLLGSLLSGGIPAFANGTNSAPGGLALYGERGPEIGFVPRGASIFSNSRSRALVSQLAAGDAQRGGSTVTISVDARGAQEGVAAQIEAVLAAAAPMIVNAAEAQTIKTLTRGRL